MKTVIEYRLKESPQSSQYSRFTSHEQLRAATAQSVLNDRTIIVSDTPTCLQKGLQEIISLNIVIDPSDPIASKLEEELSSAFTDVATDGTVKIHYLQ
jgi:hypothetical protein